MKSQSGSSSRSIALMYALSGIVVFHTHVKFVTCRDVHENVEFHQKNLRSTDESPRIPSTIINSNTTLEKERLLSTIPPCHLVADTASTFLINKTEYICDWVLEDGNEGHLFTERCGLPDVILNCPVTCRLCQELPLCKDVQDRKGKFEVPSYADPKDCEWVKEDFTPKKCKIDVVREFFCPATCEWCNSEEDKNKMDFDPAVTIMSDSDTPQTISENSGDFMEMKLLEDDNEETGMCIEGSNPYFNVKARSCDQSDEQLWQVRSYSSDNPNLPYNFLRSSSNYEGDNLKDYRAYFSKLDQKISKDLFYYSSYDGGYQINYEPPTGYYLAGIEYKTHGQETCNFDCNCNYFAFWNPCDTCTNINYVGISAMKVIFRSFQNWQTKITRILYNGVRGTSWKKLECDVDEFVAGIEGSDWEHSFDKTGYSDSLKWWDSGLYSLRILCAKQVRNENGFKVVASDEHGYLPDTAESEYNRHHDFHGFSNAYITKIQVQALDDSPSSCDYTTDIRGVTNLKIEFVPLKSEGYIFESKKHRNKCIAARQGQPITDDINLVLSNCPLKSSASVPAIGSFFSYLNNNKLRYVIGEDSDNKNFQLDADNSENEMILSSDGFTQIGISKWEFLVKVANSDYKLFNHDVFDYYGRLAKDTTDSSWELSSDYRTLKIHGPWSRAFDFQVEIKFDTVIQFSYERIEEFHTENTVCIEFQDFEQICYDQITKDQEKYLWKIGQEKQGVTTKLAFVHESGTDDTAQVGDFMVYDSVMTENFIGCSLTFGRGTVSKRYGREEGDCRLLCANGKSHTYYSIGQRGVCNCWEDMTNLVGNIFESGCDCTGANNEYTKMCVYQITRPELSFNMFGDFPQVSPSLLEGDGFARSSEEDGYRILEIEGTLEVQYALETPLDITTDSVLQFSISYGVSLPKKLGVCLNRKQHCFWVAGHDVDDNTVISTRYGGRAHRDGTLYNIEIEQATSAAVTNVTSFEILQVGAEKNAGGDGKSYLKNVAFYNPSENSNIVSHGSDSFLINLSSSFPFDSVSLVKSYIKIQMSTGGHRHIEMANDSFNIDVANPTVQIQDLESGRRYHIVLVPVDEDEVPIHNFAHMTIIESVVVSCSCSNGAVDDDLTGKPKNLMVEQRNGEVSVSFVDNSLCEEGYALERQETSGTGQKVAFAPTFFFSSENGCEEIVSPGQGYADDLSSSLLKVGDIYEYCVSAVATHYMANIQDEHSPFQKSSTALCENHLVHWEASVFVNVVLSKDSGSLPVKDAAISWQLLLADGEVVLSGLGATDESGKLSIPLMHNNPHLDNDSNFQIKVAVSKETDHVTHKFLCDNETRECTETVVWLKHLSFGHQVVFVDSTSVPIEGMVYIADTECPLVGVEVCLSKLRPSSDPAVFDSTDICVTTDASGYKIPAPVGITVTLEFDYHNHAFEANNNAIEEEGLLVEQDGIYNDIDFSDIEMTDLVIDVAGGECNKNLGRSRIEIKISGGCPYVMPIENQDSYRKFYRVPAQLIDARVADISWVGEDSKETHLASPFDYFENFVGVQTIDLRDANEGSNASGTSGLVSNVDDFEKVGTGACSTGNATLDLLTVVLNESSEISNENDCGDYCLIEYENNTTTYSLFNGFNFDKSLDKCKCLGNSETQLWKGDGRDPGKSCFKFKELSDNNRRRKKLQREKEIERNERSLSDRTLRFQYDGRVIFESVKVPQDITDNPACEGKLPDVCDRKHVDCTKHVIETGERFTLQVNLIQELVSDPVSITCDVLDEGTKIHVINNVGVLNSNDLNYYQSLVEARTWTKDMFDLVSKCRGDGCRLSVKHDIDQGNGKKSRAHIEETFLVGRPSIISPFTKDMIISVGRVQHNAYVVVTGDFVDSSQDSLMFPTHLPLLVLRDPPGGSSSVVYENVKTTLDIDIKEYEVSAHIDSSNYEGLGLAVDVDLVVTGGGISTHTGPTESTEREDLLEYNEETDTHQFSTRWSYSTSNEAVTAGEYSDMALVPNFNVIFQKVHEVSWNATDCSKKLDLKFKYNLKNAENKGAISFVTFENIKNDIIPDLVKEEKAKERELSNAADDDQNEKKTISLDLIRTALERWRQFYGEYEATNEQIKSGSSSLRKVNDWFGGQDQFGSIYPQDHWKGIVPEDLVANSYRFDNTGDTVTHEDLDLENTHRIHFLGGGNEMQLELLKNKVSEYVMNAQDYDSYQSQENSGSNFELDEQAGVQVVIEQESSTGTGMIDKKFTIDTSADETKISLILGDPDPLDEFVMDVYLDPMHGTFAFHTVSGKSSCPFEGFPTHRLEDPVLKLIRNAPVHVPSDQPMIYRIEMYNKGNASVPMEVYVDQGTNTGGLVVELNGDGSPLGFIAENGKRYEGTISVHRGPIEFQYPPLDISFRSQCEFEMNAASVRKDVSAAHFTLSNVDIGGDRAIEFAEPCPKVRWAAESMRYPIIKINAMTANEPFLPMTIFNEKSHIRTLLSEKSKRLDGVYLKYKRKLSPDWIVAKTQTLESTLIDADFALNGTEAGLESDPEDDYGFASLDWHFGLVSDGEYDLRVDSFCTGGPLISPNEYNLFSTDTIGVLIDRVSPKVYGLASPELAQNSMISVYEEVVINFSENLQCKKPYTFDLSVALVPSNVSFTAGQLLVQCNDNTISFNFKPTSYGIVSGEEATVILAGVEDISGNAMDEEYTFSFTMCNGECWSGTSALQPIYEDDRDNNAVPSNAVVKGNGCDGIDQNLNAFIDDCDEDQTAPFMRLLHSVTRPMESAAADNDAKYHIVDEMCFAEVEDAQHFLEENMNVWDDCATDLDLSVELYSSDSSGSTFKVTASDTRCVDVPNSIGKHVSSEYFHVNVFMGYDDVTKFMGCNGVDENCDGIADDCDEDRTAPEISLNGCFSISRSGDYPGAIVVDESTFGSVEEGRKFLTENVQVSDDCANDLSIDVSSPSEASCEKTIFTVTVTDPRCSNDNAIQTVEQHFILSIDDTEPVITIGFDHEDTPLYYDDEGKFLHIYEDKVSNLKDVKFWYKVEDKCPQEMDLSISFFSNELELETSGGSNIIISHQVKPSNELKVFVKPSMCKNSEQRGDVLLCTGTDDINTSFRFYEIQAKVSNYGGHVGTANVKVVVVPNDHHDSGNDDQRRIMPKSDDSNDDVSFSSPCCEDEDKFIDQGSCKNKPVDEWTISYDGALRDCLEITLNEEYRNELCMDPNVQDACPLSCGLCCKDDIDYFAPKPNSSPKSKNKDKGFCYWVRHHTEYCNEVMSDKLVKEACPVTCGFCQQTVPGYFISKIEHHVDSMNVYGNAHVDLYVDGNVDGEEN